MLVETNLRRTLTLTTREDGEEVREGGEPIAALR